MAVPTRRSCELGSMPLATFDSATLMTWASSDHEIEFNPGGCIRPKCPQGGTLD